MDSLSFNIKVPLIEKATSNVKEIISHIKLNDGIYFDKSKFDVNEIIKNLENNNIYKKIEAMKHILIAHILKQNVSNLFFDVLKNISVDNLTLKKLIYNYLILYAEGNNDLTMLSVNSFKKDLNNNDYQIRSSALKAMSCIKSIDMINILMESLKKLSKDKSPYVRKTCADVIPSIYNIDKDQFIFLRKILIDLINDKEISVVSSAVISFNCICIYDNMEESEEGPYNEETNEYYYKEDKNYQISQNFTEKNGTENKNESNKTIYEKISNNYCNNLHTNQIKNIEIDSSNENINNNTYFHIKNYDFKNNLNLLNSLSFLHPCYYKLCQYLLFMHPFHQTYLIDLLLRYCRMFYKDPLKNDKLKLKKSNIFHENSSSNENDIKNKNKKCIDYDNEISNDSSYLSNDMYEEFKKYDIDIEIFIDKLLILLTSSSYSVIIIAISSLYHLTKFTYKDNIIQAIINSLSRSSMEKNDEIYEIFLKSVKPIIIALKKEFSSYLSFFYINCIDSGIKKSLKIDILSVLKNSDNKMIILDEFIHALYLPNNSEHIIKKLFSHITAIALTNAACLSKSMKYIMMMLNSNIKLYSDESILALRQLLQQSDDNQIVKIVFFLSKILLKIQSNQVKVSVIWTLANYQKFLDSLLLFDIARLLVKSFENSSDAIKIQIIHFVFKIWLYQYAKIFLSSDIDLAILDEKKHKITKNNCMQTCHPNNDNLQNEFNLFNLHNKEKITPDKKNEICSYNEINRNKNNKSNKSESSNDVNNRNTNQKICNDSVSKSKLKKFFEKFEILCEEAFLLGTKDENFDVQDTSKMYISIMLIINELHSKEKLQPNIFERDFFNEKIDKYSFPLCYLKFMFIHSGKSVVANSINLNLKNPLIKNETYSLSECEGHVDNFNKNETPILFQLNTISNILNKKISSYIDLPEFAENDLPKIEHLNNSVISKNEEKKLITSVSSKDVKLNNFNNIINSQLFSNLDDFYKEENLYIEKQEENKKVLSKKLLINKGTKIQGEDEESDEENENYMDKCEKYNLNMENTYNSNIKNDKIVEREIEDIEQFFFSD